MQNLIFKGLNGQFKIVAANQYITRIKDSTNKIRNDKNIMGIMVNDTEFKISQLADDTTLFLKDKLSLELAINHLLKFEGL